LNQTQRSTSNTVKHTRTNINNTIKITFTRIRDGDAQSGGGRGWLAGDTDGLAGLPVTGDSGRGMQPASNRR